LRFYKKVKSLDVLIETIDESLWAACVDKSRLQGLEVDPILEEVRWGSVYFAKVARIDKALDAAFVNLDGDNIGLLHNADIRVKDKNGKYVKGGKEKIGKYIEPGQMIAVQAKGGYLPNESDDDVRSEDKNPRVSMNIVLPGRYIIFAPMENENRVSQRIRDKKMRSQLMNMLASLSACHGCILRAAAAGTQNDFLVREAKILEETWVQLQEFLTGDKPQLIMNGPDAIQRMLSDLASKSIEHIEVSSAEHYQDVEEWCELFAPDLVPRISLVKVPDTSPELGLFELSDIVDQIEDLFQPYTLLEGGGSLIIESTAALIAIDVNRGADKRAAFDVNKEAAVEIARQLRVRNLGGIIVVDFLKMKNKKEKDQLLDILNDAFILNDPCTVQTHGMTSLGLVEITRHRRTPPLLERFQSVIS
jgi:Rne/Rng family ribonuclease